jgi:hypothetical protein
MLPVCLDCFDSGVGIHEGNLVTRRDLGIVAASALPAMLALGHNYVSAPFS